MTALPASLAPPEVIGRPLADALALVSERFDAQLRSDSALVNGLCEHVQRYRGKMLRPTLVMVSGMACSPDGVTLNDGHIITATVIEMVHMATLVHDDVLDEADLRRRGQTINRLRGNEMAVILGDYLISRSFHLCSTLDSQATALRIGEVTSIVCEGEMLQLANRGNIALSEAEYREIIGRKTASLIGAACELGAAHSGADRDAQRTMYEVGFRLGCAFQIQDDVLDLVGEEGVVGKSLGRDLEKGKLTLPLIHHLSDMSERNRRGAYDAFRQALGAERGHERIVEALESTGSIAYARREAERLVEEAQGMIATLGDGEAPAFLRVLADGVVNRRF